MLHALRLAAAVSAIWLFAGLILAAWLSILFRAQERNAARWRQAERRRRWLEASR